MNDFYLSLQKETWTKLDCFVENGRYTTPKNGKIETYVLYVTKFMRNSPPSKESIEGLINFAKKHFSFTSVSLKERNYCTLVIFNNLDVGLKDNFRLE